jgi:hypothetical protein
MRFVISSLIVLLTSCVASDMPKKEPALTAGSCLLVKGKWYCRHDVHASCAKGSGFPFPVPPEQVHNDLNLPVPAGYKFIVGTKPAGVIVESRNDGRINALSLTENSIRCEWGCKATIGDDAFVHGYCVGAANKSP